VKRVEITQRNVTGKALRVEKGWEAEIDGVPVVLCRSCDGRRWQVYEPTKGRQICGTWGDTREAVLACAAERVARIAELRGISSGEFLRELIEGRS
jgi:hypothetical protein